MSHDRDFLDRTTTHILAFEGNGHIQMYMGGYTDYAAQHTLPPSPKTEKKKVLSEKPKIQEKLSYKEARELSLLPEEIEDLNQKIKQLEEKMADPTLYQRDPQGFEKITLFLQTTRHDLHHKEERWLELLEKEEAFDKGKSP